VTLIVVAGALANKPSNGGEAWVSLGWIRGLASLGYQVRFVEVIDPEDCRNGDGQHCAARDAIQYQWFESTIRRFVPSGCAALLCAEEVLGSGVQPDDPSRWAEVADLVVDISGHLARGSDLFDDFATSLFLDLDPGYTQVWHEQDSPGNRLGRHHHYASVGLGVGQPWSDTPTAGVEWIAVPPFVVLDDWPQACLPPTRPLTTVTTWRNPFGMLRWQGADHGSKHQEFRRFRDLPRRCDTQLEIATTFAAADHADRLALEECGWGINDAAIVAADPDSFRDYVSTSTGEWSVAQGVYVDLRTGWLSDRTVRYLAAGRPAIVQETGQSRCVPTGEGLLTFTDIDDAVEAIDLTRREPQLHARAARALAVRCFSADRVLPDLLARLNVGPAR
jgi:hypothetical protein